MSARVDVPCVICSAPHEATVTPGERADYEHPGSGPEVDWRRSGCVCNEHPAVDELTYWDLMNEAAIAEASTPLEGL